jgi:DNA-binding IclR family transcriptional regulator
MPKNFASAEGYSAPAVERAFRLLEAVAGAAAPPRLSDLSRELGFSKSTTHGLVRALTGIGALNQDPDSKRLSLGPTLVELAFKNREHLVLAEQVQPLLERLRDRIEETLFFGMMNRARTLIVATAEARKSMKISALPGTTIPLLAGAVGKVLLAQMTDDEARRIIRHLSLPRFTAASIVDENRFMAEVDAVRQQGVAVDIGEYLSGVHAVAVGIGKRSGVPLALWAVGFAESMGKEKMADVIQRARQVAADVRSVLGLPPD